MKTTAPYILRPPGMRDPVNCLRSFLGKIKRLALSRGDHGAALEHNVLGRFVSAECDLRATAAGAARELERRLLVTHERLKVAALDGVFSSAERRDLEKRFARIEADAAVLGTELAVPQEA